MNTNEHRVREFAYQIWESEGKPHGHDYRHWEMACNLANSQADNGQINSRNAAKTKAKIRQIGSTNGATTLGSNSSIQPPEPAKSLIDTGSLSETVLQPTAKKPAKPKKINAAENQSS